MQWLGQNVKMSQNNELPVSIVRQSVSTSAGSVTQYFCHFFWTFYPFYTFVNLYIHIAYDW